MKLKAKRGFLCDAKNVFFPNSNYEVGDIFITTNSSNPSIRFGGKWELFCPGKTLVCIDKSQSEFSNIKKIGGNKNILLNQNHIPSIDIPVLYAGNNKAVNLNSSGTANAYSLPGWSGTATSIYPELCARYINNSQKEINVLQPFIVCYIWIRIN